jgi:benzodiazapine receptor
LNFVIGFSGYIIYENLSDLSFSNPWWIYFLQLFLNFLWTPLFFGLNYLLISGIEIVFLEISIIANIVVFMNINIIAGVLLIPYSLWVGFASYLTWAIWWLNRVKREVKSEIDLNTKLKE